MTGLWPEDWRAELAKAFEPAESGPIFEVVFIGPDGQPVGEPLIVKGEKFQKSRMTSQNNWDA
jgi:hypothetical protein